MKTEGQMATRIVFPENNRVELEAMSLPKVGPTDVRVRTTLSLMSTGTEGIVLRGLYSPGTRFAEYAQFPFYPGYASIGIVEERGADVVEPAVGSVVAFRRSHASSHVLPAGACVAVPDGIEARDAAWFAMSVITFRGAYAAQYRLGDDVLIVGAGPVGQMSIRWARAAGAHHIIVVDALPDRLQHAERGGATATIASDLDTAAELIARASGGRIPSIIVDATGNANVFSSVLRLAPMYGRVVLIGDTGSPEHQHLTSDLLNNGLTVVGAHDIHDRGGWTGPRVQNLFFDLLASGRIDVVGLTTHTFTPDAAVQAYDLPSRDRGSSVGIAFDWSGLDG
jgi:2-desacetyl-2-hydroxyethyl bacteriochlorophyllide A dehydrogenase